jgi:hypothetical protein
MDLSHQGLDIAAAMIPGNVRVKVFPQSFDPIVVRTIRRQQVQHDPAFESLHGCLRDPAGVNAKIIHDDMDRFRPRIRLSQDSQQPEKQRAGPGSRSIVP